MELISCFQKHDFQIFNGEGVGGGCQNLNVAKIWLNVRIISSSLLGGNECMFQGRGYFCMSVFIVESSILCSQNGNEYFLTIRDTPGNPLCRTITAAYMREDVQVMNHFVLSVF